MSSRSVPVEAKRQRTNGRAFSRARASMSARRARNTESLARSAICPRDMDRLSSPPRKGYTRRPQHSERPYRGQHGGKAPGKTSQPLQSGSVEAIETAHARVGIGKTAGQSAQVARFGDEFRQTGDFGALQQGRDLVLALLRFQ